MDTATGATFVVAAGTLALAFVGWRQLRHVRDQVGLARDQMVMATNQATLARDQLGLARDAFLLSTRPLLADAVAEAGAIEPVQFGAPGRHQTNIGKGAFYFQASERGVLLCSLPLRNIGNGIAVIAGIDVMPAPLGDVQWTRMFVPPGESVRINISAHADRTMADPLMDACRDAGGGFAVAVNYTDTDGQETYITRAEVCSYATSAMAVRRIAVWREGDAEPFAVSGSL